MTYYEFYENAWNEVWNSFNDKKKEFILSVQGLKKSLYCAVVSVLADIIANDYSKDPDRIADRIRLETTIVVKKDIIENILRRLYEV